MDKGDELTVTAEEVSRSGHIQSKATGRSVENFRIEKEQYQLTDKNDTTLILTAWDST